MKRKAFGVLIVLIMLINGSGIWVSTGHSLRESLVAEGRLRL